MEVEVDIDWVTSGMRVVVDSLVTLSENQWNMKLTGYEVILRGRMLFVLKLSRSRLPGIVGRDPSPPLHPLPHSPCMCVVIQWYGRHRTGLPQTLGPQLV